MVSKSETSLVIASTSLRIEFFGGTGINGSNDTVLMTGRFISSPDCNEK
jgi:hypothetical protein